MIKSGSRDKVDPRDEQFAVMATQIQQLQAAQAAHATTGGNNSRGNNTSGGTNKYQVEEWILKKMADQIWSGGKPWWWCTNHNDGKGMYV